MIVFSLLLIVGAAVLLVTGLWQSSSPLLSGSIGASLLAAIVLVVGTRRAGRLAAAGEPADEVAADEPAASAAVGARTNWREPADRSARQPAHRAEREPGASHATDAGQPSGTGASPSYSQTVSIPVQGSSARGSSGHTTSAGGSAPAGLAGRVGVGVGVGAQQDTAAQPAHEPAEGSVDDEDPPDEPAPQQVSAADAARVGRMLTEVLVVDGRPRYHLPGCVHLLARESEPLPVAEALELGFTPCSLCEPDSALLADARRV